MLENLIRNIKNKKIKIVFPEGNEERIIEATEYLKHHKLVEPILLKDEETKKNKYFSKYVDQFFEMRKNKGIKIEDVPDIISKTNYFATMMLKNNEAEGYVGGVIYSTADTLRPSLQIFKNPSGEKASSYMIMERAGTILFFSDIAINIEPSAEELANIAIQTNDSVKTIWDTDPIIAMLSFSSMGSGGQNISPLKVKKATEIVKSKRSDIKIDGELQFDAAYVEHIGHLKAPWSKIPGNANVFIFPELNSANIGYKMVQYLGDWRAIGPIIQGLANPVNDLSRGATVEDIISVAIITAQQCLNKRSVDE